MSRAVALALAGLAVCAGPAPARELWRRGEASLSVSGSLREIASLTRGTDADDFADALAADPACALAASFADCAAWSVVNDQTQGTSLTRLRGRVELRAGEHLSAVVVYDHELLAGSLDTLGRSLGEGIATETWWDAEQDILDREHVRWRHLLYRGYLAFESEHLEVTLGRQRIPWGVGRLWNPIDRFNAIPPLAIEADQSPGVDAAAARVLFTGFTFLELVAAPQDDSDDSAYAGRLHGVLFDVDYSLVAGVFEEALTFGFDLAGNLGDAAARIEVVYTRPDRDVFPIGADRRRELSPFWQVVASIDYLFDVGSGLYALVEHLYNGNELGFGDGRAGPLLAFFEQTDAGLVTPGSADRFGGSRVVSFARHQTGAQLGYDVTPEVRADLLAIFDWNGQSAAFFPALRYTPADWLELTLGAQLFVGPKESQYGDAEPFGYLLAEVFF